MPVLQRDPSFTAPDAPERVIVPASRENVFAPA
jgi:hypothetical protein